MVNPTCLAAALVAAALASGRACAEEAPGSVVLRAIGQLEGASDPKCHATATRLENLMFGTPLAEEARLLKNELLKGLVRKLWVAAATSDEPGAALSGAIAGYFTADKAADGMTRLSFGTGPRIGLAARDIRHYGSVAYSLRTVLAVEQEHRMAAKPLTGLDEDALARLKKTCDLAALALLKRADGRARRDGAHEVSAGHLRGAWAELFGGDVPDAPEAAAKSGGQPLLRAIIAQKQASYAEYNQIANQLFVRNLQVYFARLSWPVAAAEARAFRQLFTETTIAFAADLYRDAARAAGGKTIREAHVASTAQSFLPHRVNAYEDVEFFPRLGAEGRVTIESHEFDAFRDSGIHWAYLGNALDDLAKETLPDADPFAAELLAEQVAQFAVLSLRMCGMQGEARGEERVSVELFEAGMKAMQKQVVDHAERRKAGTSAPPVVSVPDQAPGAGPQRFREVTAESGIDYMHRNSDWLNRLLRSYLSTGEGTGTITIPPAFGGSGVAAEDVNGDGHPDLLLLGGRGNRLYLSRGDGTFSDATARSGLAFRRESDGSPGEARQPLIADFDNDGHQDVLITYVDDPHRLYRGKGDGTFEDVTSAAALGGRGLVGGPATTFDYDGDGLLDIYISYFGDFVRGVLPTLRRVNDNGLPNRLLRNLGGMKFEDVTAKAGVGDTGWGQAAVHTDFDGDGRQDLISGNDFGTNRYYRNRGDGSFTEIAARLGTDKPSYTMSLSMSDLNSDGLPDIYVSNIVTMNKDEKYVLPGPDTRMKFNLEKLANLRVAEANDLFLSARDAQGAVRFELSTAVERGYSATGWAWDADFFDADLDGDDDLYVLNGMNEFNIYSSHSPYFRDPESGETKQTVVPVAPREANVYFENSGGKLRVPAAPSGLELEGNSRSAAYLDWDGDGDLDICVNGYNERARLYRNQTGGGRWIALDLVGDPSKGVNRDAIGAVVTITPKGGRPVWRQVSGSTGYMSVHPKRVHAGLGGAETAEVEVRWPDGAAQKLGPLAAGEVHRVER